MAITKGTGTSVLSAVTSTQTSSAVSTSGDYADAIYAKCVVVGTPTGGASFNIQQSPDGGTTYYTGPTYTFGTLVAATYYIGPIALDPTCTSVKVGDRKSVV